jgi:hypothetical protein
MDLGINEKRNIFLAVKVLIFSRLAISGSDSKPFQKNRNLKKQIANWVKKAGLAPSPFNRP